MGNKFSSCSGNWPTLYDHSWIDQKAPLLVDRLCRFGVGPAAVSHSSREVDKYCMDRREQITQMLKDRIREFKRKNAYLWEKTAEPSKPEENRVVERSEPYKDESEALAIKRALGF